MTYEDFTFEVYTDFVLDCGAPESVIEFLLEMDVYTSLMANLVMFQQVPTDWDCETFPGRLCVAVNPQGMTFSQARRFCQDMGGRLHMPTNENQNIAMAQFGVDVWIDMALNQVLGIIIIIIDVIIIITIIL